MVASAAAGAGLCMKALLKLLRRREIAFPLSLWCALWLNLNTGPWLLGQGGILAAVTFLRVWAPTGVLVICLIAFKGNPHSRRRLSPTKLLALYGMISAIAAIQSPDPGWATYWSIAYLASIAVTHLVLSTRSPILATLFLWSTWVLAVIVTMGIIRAGGSYVWAGGAQSYGIEHHIDVISSGVSRWGAICALIFLALSIEIRAWLPRLFLLAGTATGFVMVYKMQSRGSVFSTVGGVLFLLVSNRKTRRWAVPIVLLSMLAVYAYDYRQEVVGNIMTYLERGGDVQGLTSLTGRTAFWEEGLQAFQEAPLLGRGQWADRLVGIGHIHNTFIQALLNGGIVGFIPYILSWIVGWVLFVRVWKRRHSLSHWELISLNTCGAVLAFFTLRAVPETTTASYSPDLLMMLAVYAFLEKTASQPRVPVTTRYVLVQRQPAPQAEVPA